MRDGPHDRARRKHAPCKPQRGGHRGCERRVGRTTTGATRHAPPPCRGTSAGPRACAVLAKCLRQRTDSEDAPPPPPSAPPTQERGEDSEETARGHGGGGRGQTDAPGGETGGGRWGRKKKTKKEQSKPTRQGKKARRQGSIPRRTGGGRGDMGPQETLVRYPTSGVWGPKGETHPPHCSQVPHPYLRRACVVPATCVLQREDDKGAPPPPPHTPPPPRGWGMTVAERGPSPEDKAAGWGGSGERTRDGPHDRAQREHALCMPQRGDHRGCERRVGRATTGATRQAPPPPAEGQVPRLVPAPCSRRAYARGQAARKPPPPTPFSSTHPGKGRGQRGDSEGTWGGGAEDRPKRRGERRVASGGGAKTKKQKKQRTPTRQSRGRQQGQTGHGRSQEARQGARDRGTPLGKKAGRQGPTPQRTPG